jgi:CBS domain-containing protein
MVTAQDLLRKEFVSVDVKDSVSQMLGAMKKSKLRSALVFDGKKYLGIISKRFLLTSRINPAEMKVGNIIKKRSKSKTPFYVPILEPATDLKKICRLMAASDSHALPVMKNDKVLGVVAAEDVIQEIAGQYSKIACQEFSSQPITARPDDELSTAIQIFSRAGIDHLPIVDEQNRLVGMVAVTDVIENPNLWNLTAQKISPAASHQGSKKTGYAGGEKTRMTSLPVKNYLSRKQLCCTNPETRIPEAVKLMVQNNVCSIVLVKYDKPVGIMTIKDLLVDYAK